MTKKNILKGHKKVGKKFIPPFMQYPLLHEVNVILVIFTHSLVLFMH